MEPSEDDQAPTLTEEDVDDDLFFYASVLPKFSGKKQVARAEVEGDVEQGGTPMIRLLEKGYLVASSNPANVCLANGDPMVLNAQRTFLGEAGNAVEVADKLRRHLLRLHSTFITEAGVDYERMRESRDFAEYRVAALELQKVDLTELQDRPEALPFYLNIYNCLVLQATASVPVPSSTMGRVRFYGKIAYRFGRGWTLTANDLEHGVLRGNRAAPGTLLSSSHWSRNDPRTVLALAEPDCRVHFALNCGARSCPPIRVFSAKNIERALQLAAEGFLRETVAFDGDRNVVTLSKIICWYRSDFPKDLLSWIVTFLEPTHPLKEKTAKTKIVYSSYDWSVNDATTATTSE